MVPFFFFIVCEIFNADAEMISTCLKVITDALLQVSPSAKQGITQWNADVAQCSCLTLTKTRGKRSSHQATAFIRGEFDTLHITSSKTAFALSAQLEFEVLSYIVTS